MTASLVVKYLRSPRSLHNALARIWSRDSIGGTAARILAMRITGMALIFASTIILTRTLGPHEYGAYAFGYALLMTLAIPASFGLDNYLASTLPKLRQARLFSAANKAIRNSFWLGVTASVATYTALIALHGFGLAPISNELMISSAIALSALPALCLLYVRLGVLRGLNRTAEGQFPLIVLFPLIVFALVSLCAFTPTLSLTHTTSTSILAIASLLALSISLAVSKELFFSNDAHSTDTKKYRCTCIAAQAGPYAVIGSLAVIISNIAIIMTGYLAGAQEAGVLQPAVMLATFVALGHNIINQPLAPRLAELYARSDFRSLQTTVDRACRAGLMFGVIVAAMLITFGHELLNVFGPGFSVAYSALLIIALSQLGSVSLGPSSVIMMISGRERQLALIMLVSATTAITLGTLLIPSFGAVGASIAFSVSLLLWTATGALFVYKTIGIRSSIFFRMLSN